MPTQVVADSQVSKSAQQLAAIGEQLDRLNAHKDSWATTTPAERAGYLEEIRRRANTAAESWVAAASMAKGVALHSQAAGEEWGSGPWALIHCLNKYVETLSQLVGGLPISLPEDAIRRRPDGQVVARVFPESTVDGFLLNGVQAEVWLDPSVDSDDPATFMGGTYQARATTGRVSAVLGAGNVSSIGPLDVLHLLLAEHSVVILKMNPVNDYLGPTFEFVFEPLISAGYMAVAYGGADIGAYITRHPVVEHIHITGSDRTHDAIVWGTGPEAVQRRRAGNPLNDRPITSELGNISPLIVVPGPWDDEDLVFQAEHIATTKLHNVGFNCVATQVLVLPQEWDRRDALMDAVRAAIEAAPSRPAYYPGAVQRVAAATSTHEDASALPHGDRVLIEGLDSSNLQEGLFHEECFAGVLSTTTIAGDTPATFLRAAVDFCNNSLWGTLGATILVHPKTARELGPALEDSIADLRYGTIGVNIWCGAGFLLSELPWGAFPGHSRDSVGSGIGKVHNTKLFDNPQKAVLYGPFYPYPRSLLMGGASLLPKPAWFVTHRRAFDANKAMTGFEYDHDPARILGMFVASLLG